MDTTASEITFDDDGVCGFCHEFEEVRKPNWHPDGEGQKILDRQVEEIKAAGSGREFDCMFGLSGGIDSSFLALQVKRLGLRPLVVHVDTGWNTELAVNNIENVVRRLSLDLHTEVIDWDEMRDIQVAFFRAGVVNQDIPQDNAIFATLHRIAVEAGIGYMLHGFNIVTESILPGSWGFDNMDSKHIRAIHDKFGTAPLTSYPLLGFEELCALRYGFPNSTPYKEVAPLDLLPYNKPMALRTVAAELGFRDYGTKHGESRFTKFYQEYFLPERFGYDKRRAHYSSLIVAGQLSREDAMKNLEQPPYDPEQLANDRSYFIKKLAVGNDEFEGFLNAPKAAHSDFPNYRDSFAMVEELSNHARRLRLMWANLARQADA